MNSRTRNTKKVYPTPSKVTMTGQTKAESVEYTYPLLYFAIDDFTDAWKGITLTKPGDMICVELFATGNFFSKENTPIRVRLFAGGLEYDTVKKNYSERTSSMWSSRNDQFFKLIVYLYSNINSPIRVLIRRVMQKWQYQLRHYKLKSPVHRNLC